MNSIIIYYSNDFFFFSSFVLLFIIINFDKNKYILFLIKEDISKVR